MAFFTRNLLQRLLSPEALSPWRLFYQSHVIELDTILGTPSHLWIAECTVSVIDFGVLYGYVVDIHYYVPPALCGTVSCPTLAPSVH